MSIYGRFFYFSSIFAPLYDGSTNPTAVIYGNMPFLPFFIIALRGLCTTFLLQEPKNEKIQKQAGAEIRHMVRRRPKRTRRLGMKAARAEGCFSFFETESKKCTHQHSKGHRTPTGMASASLDSNDSLSSDDSDDDFLANAGEGVDREALVRKKLLESFYGKATVVDEEDSGNAKKSARPSSRRVRHSTEEAGNAHDLDSPSFDAGQHAVNHISTSTTKELLETEERLALQVRNLDSTMQTLVYENYSRFIDATDAIRSIGVNVQANEAGLKSLTESMGRVSDRTRKMDEALKGVRDQVAEKIRIQRLMARLDALLKLPATLKQQIAAGQLQKATRSYLSTASILAKHSEGFESLKSIESQCKSILEDLETDLGEKILYWSGKSLNLDVSESNVTYLPKVMSEIFECVGALNILRLEKGDETSQEDLLSMAVASAMRLLDRMLDSHMIDVQERRFGSGMSGLMNKESSVTTSETSLIPKNFLDAVLEGASYFIETFGETEESSSQGVHLMEFVSESFSSFLSHVKVVLLEESSQSGDVEDVDEDQREISTALSLLVQSIQDLEIGMTDAGVPQSFTSKMVDDVLDLTESMVRRRVEQKFYELQQQVVKECLCPFATKVAAQNDDGPLNLEEIVKMATSMLSDCLQLVDDAIRSIFVESSADDMPKVKTAVESSTRAFSMWLANTFEILAGGEPMIDIVEAPLDGSQEADSDDEDNQDSSLAVIGDRSFSGLTETGALDLLYVARDEIICGDSVVRAEFTLAMVELCRLAVTSVPENIHQSSSTHMGGTTKKKSRGVFPADDTLGTPVVSGSVDGLGIYFASACSLLLTNFVLQEGERASDVLCLGFSDNSMKVDGDDLTCPSDFVVSVLEIGKEIALRCSSLFTCQPCGGPVPVWSEDIIPSPLSVHAGRKTGLQLDVERMFKENVSIFSHPKLNMGASANEAMFLFLKIVLRSARDLVRCQTFSPRGFQQCMIDSLFMKHLIPHYVDNKFTEGEVNACSALTSLVDDVVDELGDRCTDPALRGDRGAIEDVAVVLRDSFSSSSGVSDRSFVIPCGT